MPHTEQGTIPLGALFLSSLQKCGSPEAESQGIHLSFFERLYEISAPQYLQ
ncbi:MAG: hypothetical protein NC041_06870 [Bacteroides sp.]|nr:hypothetical protein [Bacteroides sp.]